VQLSKYYDGKHKLMDYRRDEMERNMDKIKDDLLGKVGFAMWQVQATQIVHFKSRGKDYAYASLEGKEFWSVPAEEHDTLQKLLKCIRQLEKQMDDLEPKDGVAANKFVSRYFRMRSDSVLAAGCLSVRITPNKRYLAEDRTALARLRKAAVKMELLTVERDAVEPAK
jgi:hypothetical protein